MQINCVYNYGSTGKITRDLHHYLLSQGIGSVVYYGRGEKTDEPGVTKLCSEVYAKANNLRSRITGLMYGGCFLSTRRLIRAIEKEQPDVVHLQCINGYFVNIYKLLSWLKEKKIRTVLTLHAEFMYTGNCGYALDCEKWRIGCGSCPRLRQETLSWCLDRTAESRRRFRDIYRDWEELTVVSVSPWLKDRAKGSPLLKDRAHRVILNGVDTDVFYCRKDTDIRETYGIREEKLVFHATPSFTDDPGHLKGGYYLLELAKRMPQVRFLVAGNCSLSGPIPENVTLLGQIRDRQLLATLYSAADLTLLTSKKETFSMVCAESLCCGTPVVGFEAGGPEQISLPEYSEFVKPEDLDALEVEVSRWLGKNVDKAGLSDEATAHYARQRMLREYVNCYKGMGAVVPPGDIAAMAELLTKLTKAKPELENVNMARRYHDKRRMAEEYVALYSRSVRVTEFCEE